MTHNPNAPMDRRSPKTGVDDQAAKIYLVGGGIASMSAAAFLIRDGDVIGKNIIILEESGVVPVMITYGEQTRSFYRIAAEGAASCIPGAQLVTIPGGRHLAIVQQPDAFNAALLQFLSKASSQPKP
jgi:pimeloyl-ACP methyl ester carboxylesterase